eukprot:Colp12_sorted_trinity150504_noHs@13631
MSATLVCGQHPCRLELNTGRMNSVCDNCQKTNNGTLYHCPAHLYDICTVCAEKEKLPSTVQKKIHKCSLTYTADRPFAVCDVCKGRDTIFYSCIQHGFDLCKNCAVPSKLSQAPRESMFSLRQEMIGIHPEHRDCILLHEKDEKKDICSLCNELQMIDYVCPIHKWMVCQRCCGQVQPYADDNGRAPRAKSHPAHTSCLLLLNKERVGNSCRVCRRTDDTMYSCFKHDFDLCRFCSFTASVPRHWPKYARDPRHTECTLKLLTTNVGAVCEGCKSITPAHYVCTKHAWHLCVPCSEKVTETIKPDGNKPRTDLAGTSTSATPSARSGPGAGTHPRHPGCILVTPASVINSCCCMCGSGSVVEYLCPKHIWSVCTACSDQVTPMVEDGLRTPYTTRHPSHTCTLVLNSSRAYAKCDVCQSHNDLFYSCFYHKYDVCQSCADPEHTHNRRRAYLHTQHKCPLVLTDASLGVRCESCHKLEPALYTCQQHSFSLCSHCAMTGQEVKVARHQAHGCLLVRRLKESVCDLCTKSAPETYTCQTHTFDLCLQCAGNPTLQRPAHVCHYSHKCTLEPVALPTSSCSVCQEADVNAELYACREHTFQLCANCFKTTYRIQPGAPRVTVSSHECALVLVNRIPNRTCSNCKK